MVLAIAGMMILLCAAAGCTGHGSENSGSSRSGTSGSGSGSGGNGATPDAYFTVNCHYEVESTDGGESSEKTDAAGTIPLYLSFQYDVKEGGTWQTDGGDGPEGGPDEGKLAVIASRFVTLCPDNECDPLVESYHGPAREKVTVFHNASDPANEVTVMFTSLEYDSPRDLTPYVSWQDSTVSTAGGWTKEEVNQHGQEVAERLATSVDGACLFPLTSNENLEANKAGNGFPYFLLEDGFQVTYSNHTKTDSGSTDIDAIVTFHKGTAPVPMETPVSLTPLATTPGSLAPLVTATPAGETITLVPLVTTPEPLAPLIPSK